MSRICIVFAGREDRMQILMHYLNKALKEKKLDEIHLWNYSRNDSDTTWVNSLKSDKIKIFASDDRTKIDYENGGSSWKVDNFSLVWKEYTKEIYEDSLFVKMDDDIVYVDITKFDEIFDFVKNNDTLWTTPIIVNNSLTINTTNFMEVIRAGDKIVDIINDHKAAELMHELFTNNKLTNTIFSPIVVKQYEPNFPRAPKVVVDNKLNWGGDRLGTCFGGEYMGYIQINTLFFNKHLIEHIKEIFKTREHFIDETMFNYPCIKDCKYKPYVYPSIMCSHLSFGAQDEKFDSERILSMYKKIISE